MSHVTFVTPSARLSLRARQDVCPIKLPKDAWQKRGKTYGFLNNLVEHDHRFIKRRSRTMLASNRWVLHLRRTESRLCRLSAKVSSKLEPAHPSNLQFQPTKHRNFQGARIPQRSLRQSSSFFQMTGLNTEMGVFSAIAPKMTNSV